MSELDGPIMAQLVRNNDALRAKVAALEATCRSAGICMSCLYGVPDPIGCTDCLGTGWDGGSPYDQIKVLEARVTKLEAALNDLRPNVDYHGHKKLDAALKDVPGG